MIKFQLGLRWLHRLSFLKTFAIDGWSALFYKKLFVVFARCKCAIEISVPLKKESEPCQKLGECISSALIQITQLLRSIRTKDR